MNILTSIKGESETLTPAVSVQPEDRLTSLPYDILYKLASYLGPKDLQSLAGVNRDLRSFSEEYALIKQNSSMIKFIDFLYKNSNAELADKTKNEIMEFFPLSKGVSSWYLHLRDIRIISFKLKEKILPLLRVYLTQENASLLQIKYHRKMTKAKFFEDIFILANDTPLDKDFESAKAIHNPRERLKAVLVVFYAFLKIGNPVRALEVANKIDNDFEKANALREICRDFSQQINLDKVLEVTNTIDYERVKAFVLMEICKAFLQQGNLDKALETANTIDLGFHKAHALAEVFKVFLRQGNLDKALEIANTMDCDKDLQALAFVEICKTFPQQINLDKVLEMANTMNCDLQKAYALGGICIAFLRQGNPDKALEIANTINYPPVKESTIQTILQTQIRASQQQDPDSATDVRPTKKDAKNNKRCFESLKKFREHQT